MTLRSFLGWIAGMFWLPFYMVYDLLSGSLRVSKDILTPGEGITPAIVEVPLRCHNNLEISLMSNLVSLSPGVITVATRREPPTVWVHAMYVEDRPSILEYVRTIEDHVLRATRPSGGPPPRLEEPNRTEGGRRR